MLDHGTNAALHAGAATGDDLGSGEPKAIGVTAAPDGKLWVLRDGGVGAKVDIGSELTPRADDVLLFSGVAIFERENQWLISVLIECESCAEVVEHRRIGLFKMLDGDRAPRGDVAKKGPASFDAVNLGGELDFDGRVKPQAVAATTTGDTR